MDKKELTEILENKDPGVVEYTIKIRVEPFENHMGIKGFKSILIGADGSERVADFLSDTLLEAQETGVYLLKIEAERLLKLLQEANS